MATQEYGSLRLGFIMTGSDVAYDSKGTGCNTFLVVFRPTSERTPETPYHLGHVVVTGHDHDTWPYTLVVGTAEGAEDLLAEPVGYERVWTDEGTGGELYGACWRPIPPAGYKALGYMFTQSYDTPTDSRGLRCVREDYVQERAAIGDLLWDDHGGGGDYDLALYPVQAPKYDGEDAVLLIAPGTFIGVGNYDKPDSDPGANVLKVPAVEHDGSQAALPVMDSYGEPTQQTQPACDRSTLVPYTAVKDGAKDEQWKAENSPFYTVERWVSYSRILFLNNQSELVQPVSDTVTTGVSKSDTDTFSASVGIMVGFETGVDFLGEEAKVMGSITTTLGYESSHTTEFSYQESVERTLNVAAQHAGAEYVASHEIRVMRADGTEVSGGSLSFDASDSYVILQYPPAGPGEAPAVHSVTRN
ncbi:Vps62-related protein [Streptomyces klenkii]|uniref:Vps62-related protein n=1 Tax=Streptomyces klenkii TaxID=1420899 RepID=UPI0034340806